MLLFSLIEQAAIVQGLGVMGIERDRLVELGERLFGLSGSRQRLTSRGVGLGVARACLGWSRPRRWVLIEFWRQRSQIDRAAAERDQGDDRERARAEARSSGKGMGNRTGDICGTLACLHSIGSLVGRQLHRSTQQRGHKGPRHRNQISR